VLAIIALVCDLTLFLLVISPVFFIISLIMAGRASSRIRESGGRVAGRGKVTAARVISIIAILLFLGGIALYVATRGDDNGSRKPAAAAQGGGVEQTAVGAYDKVKAGGVGTCFNDFGEPEVVDCSGPHDGELVGVETLSGSTYPGETTVQKEADDRCGKLLDGYLSEAAAQEDQGIYYAYPTASSWLTGDREIVCALTGKDNAKLTGSHKG
jgi:hypothetical protein